MNEEKKQQILALGRLGWSLRRIQRATRIRRETISAYLKEAEIVLRLPRGRLVCAKPASGVTTDDIARAITGHRRGMASRKTEASERGGSSRGARPRDLR